MDTIMDTIMKLKSQAGFLEVPAVAASARKEMLRLADVLKEQLRPNSIKIKVIKARQSPLNKMQWLCELECGHKDVWVTSKSKPKNAICYEIHP